MLNRVQKKLSEIVGHTNYSEKLIDLVAYSYRDKGTGLILCISRIYCKYG